MTTSPTNRPFPRLHEGAHVSAEVPEGFDWSQWYLTEEEDMGQSLEQFECIALLLSILTALVVERGQQNDVYVGADQFFQWVRGEENVQVSPDLYVMEPHPPVPRPRSIQTWREGHHPPRLAIEIVSTEWRKDYDQNPPKYAQIGVEELLIFDPDAARSPSLPGLEEEHERVALQLYQRDPSGGLVCVERGQGPLFSDVLQVWLLVVTTPTGPRLRLSYGPSEESLIASSPEALEQSRHALRRMHSQLEQALQAHEDELQARTMAEQRRDMAEQRRDMAEQQRDMAEQQRDAAEQQRDAAVQALRASLALAEEAGATPEALAQLRATLEALGE